MLSPEELLKPRYKVIADWPGVAGKISIGDIIVSDGATNGFWVAGQPFMEDKLKDYPHLFRKLQWWEERKPEDMPQYVREENGRVHKIKKCYNEYDAMWFEYMSGETKITYCVNNRTMVFFQPATETEYNKYNLKLKNNENIN